MAAVIFFYYLLIRPVVKYRKEKRHEEIRGTIFLIMLMLTGAGIFLYLLFWISGASPADWGGFVSTVKQEEVCLPDLQYQEMKLRARMQYNRELAEQPDFNHGAFYMPVSRIRKDMKIFWKQEKTESNGKHYDSQNKWRASCLSWNRKESCKRCGTLWGLFSSGRRRRNYAHSPFRTQRTSLCWPFYQTGWCEVEGRSVCDQHSG